jgi:[ribosomal protein S5]-alanine N-acetyltransferase
MVLEQPLKTARLTLRSLEPSEAGGPYLGWMRDPAVLRYLEVRHRPPEQSSQLARFVVQSNEHPSVLLLGIFLSDGRHIGNVKLGECDPHHHRADIGFLIGDRTCWGMGFASEAVEGLATYALKLGGLRKLVAGCYSDNTAAARVLEKAGFVIEATLRAHWLLDDVPQDGLLFARHRAVGS